MSDKRYGWDDKEQAAKQVESDLRELTSFTGTMLPHELTVVGKLPSLPYRALFALHDMCRTAFDELCYQHSRTAILNGRLVWLVKRDGDGWWVCYPPEREWERPTQPEWVEADSLTDMTW